MMTRTPSSNSQPARGIGRRVALCLGFGAAMLGLLAAGCAVDPMEELMQKKESPKVSDKEQATLALANLNDQRALRALVELLESDEDVCDIAGVALVKKGRESHSRKKPDPVVEAVQAVMANTHLAEPFRARAAWTLGEIGNRDAIPALKTASADAKVPVADAAKKALDKLGYTNVAEPFEVPEMGRTVQVLQPPAPVVKPPEAEKPKAEAKPEKPPGEQKAAPTA